jgi:hypothetical protein
VQPWLQRVLYLQGRINSRNSNLLDCAIHHCSIRTLRSTISARDDPRRSTKALALGESPGTHARRPVLQLTQRHHESQRLRLAGGELLLSTTIVFEFAAAISSMRRSWSPGSTKAGERRAHANTTATSACRAASIAAA